MFIVRFIYLFIYLFTYLFIYLFICIYIYYMLKAPLPFNLLNPLPWFMIVLLVIVNPSWKDQMWDMKLDHSQKDYPRSEDLGLLSITSTPETPGIIQDIPTMKIDDNLIQLVQQTYWSSRFSMQQPRGCYMRLSCVFNPQHQNWHQLRYPKKTRWFNQVLERYAHQSSIIRWKYMFPEPTWPHAALFCLSHSTHLLPFAHPLWDETTKSSRWQAPRHPRSIRTASARQCHAVTFTSKIWVEALAHGLLENPSWVRVMFPLKHQTNLHLVWKIPRHGADPAGFHLQVSHDE